MIYTVTLNPAVQKELVVTDIAIDAVSRSQKINVDCGGNRELERDGRWLAPAGSKASAANWIN